MALLTIHYYSPALEMASVMHAVLPDALAPETRIVMLLGPEGSESAWWLRACPLERIADELGVAFVLPAVLQGCGFDMAYGYRFGESICQSVPAYLERNLPVLRLGNKRMAIAGYRLGGTGAVHAALSCPERFDVAASFGGCLDIAALYHGEVSNAYLTEKRRMCLWGKTPPPPDSELHLRCLLQRRQAEGCKQRFFIVDAADSQSYRASCAFADAGAGKNACVLEEWDGADAPGMAEKHLRGFIAFVNHASTVR